jgi:hypothetical protein
VLPSRSLSTLYFFLSLLMAIPALAQVAGTLTGRVVDPSGAAVPGAKIGVYMPGGKAPLLSGKTNSAGLFSFIAVQPDNYEVAVEAAGFAKKRIAGVKVDPVQETSLGAIRMEVQSTTVTVEVTTEVQSVQLANAEVSSTITSQQVENLPVLGRQVSNLYSTQAGVNATNDVTSINGLGSSLSTVTIDGINVQDNFIRTNALDYPPMRTTIDQIAEITISTSNTGATIGGGASQVVMVTKSGSNTYHGSVYWYNRNSDLAANNWFNNQAHVGQPQLDLNQAGAALGGRIIRDKLFFYGNYEGYRSKQQSSIVDTTLTDTAKQGIFQYKTSSGVLQQANLLNLRAISLDPTIKAMISSLPAPNTTTVGDGLNTAGYRFNAASNQNRDQVVYKMDYYLSPKQNFSGTYNFISNPTDRPTDGSFFTVTPPVANAITNHLMSLAYRWTLTPTLTNELRGGFMLSSVAFVDSNKYPAYQLSGLLFTDPVNTFMNQGRHTNTYSLQDNANWVRGKHMVQFGYQSSFYRIAPYNDAGILPTYALGLGSRNTSLTSTDLPGASTSNLSTANSLYADLAGYVSSASQTFNVTSPSSGYVPGATHLRHLSYNTFAGYAQDNWKVLPHATVTLGLRYEIWTPATERDSLYLTPNLENGNIIKTLLDPNAILNFSGGANTPLYKTDKNNFAPNVGLAWDPFGHGKTAIRAGYMISFANDNVVTAVTDNAASAAGLSTSAVVTPGNNLASLASPFPIPTPAFQVPRTVLQNYLLNTQDTEGRPDPNLVTPYVQQWTLSIQHEIKGTIFEARYVGNHGTKLIRAFDYNQVLYNQDGFLADFKRAQSNLALSGNKSAAYNATIPGSQPLTVLPLLPAAMTNATLITDLQEGQVGTLAAYEEYNYGLGNVPGSINFFNNPLVLASETVANGGSSSYNGLQLEMRKRTRAGLQYQFSYSFSKTLSNVASDSQTDYEPLLDNNNPSLEKARSPYDITHVFKANYYYELPYGPNKRWHGNRIMNAVAGGWALSGIWSYSSGEPYSILSGLGTLNRAAQSYTTNTADIGVTTLSALNALTNGVFMTGNGPYFLSPTVINPVDGRGAEYGTTFSGEMFSDPGPGTVGDTQRRMFTGPWQQSWDMSLKKGFRLYERSTLDLHFDFFNYLNHPTFYIPPSTNGDYGLNGSLSNTVNVNYTSFGKLTGMNYGPRVMQIGAYFRF